MKPLTIAAAMLSLVLSAACSGPPETVSGSSAEARTMGFAFTYLWFSIYESPEDCPDGLNLALRDVAIMDLSQAEQERLVSPPHRSEYTNLGMDLGRQRNAQLGGESSCNYPEKFDDPPQRLVQGAIAFGKDLDGYDSTTSDPGPASCPHPDFESPDGAKGIDNQLYRVLGCIESYRQDSLYVSSGMKDFVIGAHHIGQITTLLEIRDVDDPRNDDAVEVSVFSSDDPVPYDSAKSGLPHASFTATDNPRWHNSVRGKIVDGVLLTEPFDLLLKFGYRKGTEYDIKGARIELALAADGTATGSLVGYYDKDEIYAALFKDKFGEVQAPYGYTCPAVHEALAENADGYPDADTGECTAISTAFDIQAVPAFIFQPDRMKTEEEVAAIEAETSSKKWGQKP